MCWTENLEIHAFYCTLFMLQYMHDKHPDMVLLEQAEVVKHL